MSFRRFVNLISSDSYRCVYSLRRIDMSRFFLPCAAKNKINLDAGDCSLPDPVMNFYSPERSDHYGTMEFMFVDNKVVAADGTGGALMYDTDLDAVRSLPNHGKMRKFSFSVAAGNNLYNIDSTRNCSANRRFEALVYIAPTVSERPNWQWRSLPPPPGDDDGGHDSTCIDSCAVVAGGSQILFTARASNKSCTYSFDTTKLLWGDKPLLDWALPFTGCAEYIPELAHCWFGISSKEHGNVLCAADLAARPDDSSPSVTALLDDMAAGPPKECHLVSARSVYLGSGKFCIARFFNVSTTVFCHETQLPHYVDEDFAILAGVEVVVTSSDGPKFRLVKHHEERYMLEDIGLHWLF
ncbi:hypothetical protein QOZ80_2AG0150740 [Eleusine coracana subsp. coracana]|nr:hypothetical protein QOZ80_2AG0150740 [Eleusine coracana subsp. coracana]